MWEVCKFMGLPPKMKNNHQMNITYSPGFSLHAQVLVQITLLMTGTLQLTENVLLRSRAWTWPHCHHVNVPGMMDQGPLTTGKWMLQVDLQRTEAKVKSPLYWKLCVTLAHFSVVGLSRIPYLFRGDKAELVDIWSYQLWSWRPILQEHNNRGIFWDINSKSSLQHRIILFFIALFKSS